MPVLPRIFGGPAGQTAQVFNENFNHINQPIVNIWPWTMWAQAGQLRSTAVFNPSPMGWLLGACAIVANQGILQIGGPAAQTFQMRSFLTPAVFWGPLLDGKAQFSQYKIVADNSTGPVANIRCGPAVFCQQAEQASGGYILQINAETLQLALYRGMGSGGTNAQNPPLIPAGTMPFAFGDTVRVEATPTATTNEVTCKVNGATVGTFSDNDPSRPVVGFPAIALIFCWSSAFFQTIDDYSGGPL